MVAIVGHGMLAWQRPKTVWTNTRGTKNFAVAMEVLERMIYCLKRVFVKVLATNDVTELQEGANGLDDVEREKPCKGRQIHLYCIEV